LPPLRLQAISVALKERPDAIILLDLGLPGGNGLIVLQRLHSNTSLGGIPVIIVTAEDPQVAEGRTIEAGAVAFSSKACGSRSAHSGSATGCQLNRGYCIW
jgi:DNA-binding response OmpR family regulator